MLYRGMHIEMMLVLVEDVFAVLIGAMGSTSSTRLHQAQFWSLRWNLFFWWSEYQFLTISIYMLRTSCTQEKRKTQDQINRAKIKNSKKNRCNSGQGEQKRRTIVPSISLQLPPEQKSK